MKKLKWIFDEEETNPNDSPLKKGDRIDYIGKLIFTPSLDKISTKYTEVYLKHKRITKVKKYKDKWVFKIVGHSLWFFYNDKYITILNEKDNHYYVL